MRLEIAQRATNHRVGDRLAHDARHESPGLDSQVELKGLALEHLDVAHGALVDKFCDSVERLTGRKVRAFISGIDTVADLATEMFVLHPRGYEGPARSESVGEEI